MESNSTVKISGPITLRILRDPETDRYFYIFGDMHFSLDNSCSQMSVGTKCDRPSFDYRGVITTNTNCWTISAMFHEVFVNNQKKRIPTDYYREIDPKDEMYASNVMVDFIHNEILPRRMGMYREPKSRQEAEEIKRRLKHIRFDWMSDVYSMLWEKSYGSYINIINADTRHYNNTTIVPMSTSQNDFLLIEDIKEEIERYQTIGDSERYKAVIGQIIESLKSLFLLAEQLASDSYMFLKYFFETEDYIEASRRILEFIPSESDATKEIIKNIRKSIEGKYGFHTSFGKVITMSSASLARLRKYKPEMHSVLMLYIKTYLRRESSKIIQESPEIFAILEAEDFSSPELMGSLIDLIPDIIQVLGLSLNLTTMVMDSYVLSESLQKNTKDNIYYIGDAHAENYFEFLTEYLGFEVIEVIEKKELPGKNNDFPDYIRCVESKKLGELLDLYNARESLFI